MAVMVCLRMTFCSKSVRVVSVMMASSSAETSTDKQTRVSNTSNQRYEQYVLGLQVAIDSERPVSHA